MPSDSEGIYDLLDGDEIFTRYAVPAGGVAAGAGEGKQ
ncbi:hypothetical protein BWQ96_00193 [Gracilariopsis chorda]|uniref:Uncharacterized protein n=1 Tax=Gracilariopsis chorda TaxID=448386 RepID=A0A2V3J6U7_9FLOR|nr:hypothetical protein BWQ96_00193 [Gracilariopsis chorda]|eukprot:PXF50033.1 hypothetical protein BWQ96_00193 [Gracilariopsis chorda]